MYYFTREGLEKFKLEFEAIQHEYYEKLKLNNFDKETNLSESGSFLHTRNELYNRFKAKKSEFEHKINNAIIIEDTEEFKNWDKSTVITKSIVTFKWNEEIEEFKILGVGEEDVENNIITYEAPIAQLLLGHRVGDVLDFRNSKIEIIDIQPIKVKKLEKTND